MKIDWLFDDVTAVGYIDRAAPTFLGMILSIFRTIQAAFVVGEPLCDVGIPS